MNVLLSMLLAVFIGSLYPVAAVLGLEGFDPFAFVFLASFASFLSSAIFMFIWTKKSKRNNDIHAAINLVREEHVGLIIITGLCTTLCHIFFLVSLFYMSKAGASVIFETWPVWTMLLAPLLITKNWDKLKPIHLFLTLVCFAGVVLIGLSDQIKNYRAEGISWSGFSLNFEAMVGMVLALLGSFTCTISALYRGELSQLWKELLPNQLIRVSLSECLTRLIGLPVAIGCYLLMGETPTFSLPIVTTVVLVGLFFTSINILYTYALMEAQSSSINLVWYLQPVLAVLWLYLLGLSEITTLIIAGMVLVVIANVVLAIVSRKKRLKPLPKTHP